MSQRQGEIRTLTEGMLRAQERFGRPTHDLLVEDYAGMTLEEMAAKYGVSYQTVINWMTRLGVRRRLGGQRPPLRTNGEGEH